MQKKHSHALVLEQSKPGEEELDACFPSVVTLALGSFWFSDRLRVIEAGLPSMAPRRGTNKHLAEDRGNNLLEREILPIGLRPATSHSRESILPS